MKRILAIAILLCSSTLAFSHFRLMAPQSKLQQNASGDPQKTPPCGGAGTATNAVTMVQTGGTLTVTIDETITHPGHYRIAIAQNEGMLPAPPTVTPVGNDPCGMTTIITNPQLPILADGVFEHAVAFSGPQTMQIQLPAGYTCDNCVVQVLEYMSNHTAPCFYHHCATVTITDNPQIDGPPSASDDLPVTPGDEGGCCSTQRDPVTSLAGTALIGLLVMRKRRGSSRSRA